MVIELWLVFSILSAVLWASTNIIDKSLIPKHIKTPILPLFTVGAANLILAFVVLLVVHHTLPSFTNIILSLATGAIWGFVPFVYFKSLLTEDVSRVISLFSISPLLVLIFATVFLGEALSYSKYVGVFSMIAGSILISLKFDGKKKFSINKNLLLVVAGTFFISISQVLSKSILNEIPYWDFYVWYAIGFFLTTALISIARINDLSIISTLKPNIWVGLILSRFLGVGGLVAFITSLSLGLASLVSAVYSIQSFFVLIFVLILGFFRHHLERAWGIEGFLKFIAAILIIYGVFVITVT